MIFINHGKFHNFITEAIKDIFGFYRFTISKSSVTESSCTIIRVYDIRSIEFNSFYIRAHKSLQNKGFLKAHGVI